MFGIITSLFTDITLVFWATAIVGTTLFVLRMLMTLIGGVVDADTSFDMDADSDFGEQHDGEHHDASVLRLFTLHSFSGFLMMFGWTGLACIEQWHMSVSSATILAFVAGLGVMVTSALLFRSAHMLVSTGDRFAIEDTIGLTATVYQQIPAHGQGKIQVMVNGTTRELLALSYTHTPIESFTIVRIVAVADHETVLVIKSAQQ